MKTNLFSSLLSQTAQLQMSQQVRNNSRLRMAAFALLTILCLALCSPAFADLYNNGPTNGTSGAYLISSNAISNSFTVASSSTITGFTFTEWIPQGSTALTIDWSIGTTSFGSDIASGINDPVTSVVVCNGGQPYNGGTCGGDGRQDAATVINSSRSNIKNNFVEAGQTLWLTLWGAVDSFGGKDGWDINSGASMAYHDQLGQVPSESFTIDGGPGNGGSTPEPSSILLCGSGLLGIAGVLRRKMS